MCKSATYPPSGEATHSDLNTVTKHQGPSPGLPHRDSEKIPRRRRKNPRKIRLPTESAQRPKNLRLRNTPSKSNPIIFGMNRSIAHDYILKFMI